MGLFSAKKKTYVSSVVYPLGEDGEKRTDMMKHTVLNAMLQKKGIAESIRETYLRGQGMMLRNAFRYARDTYTNGLPTSAARYSDQPDLNPLRAVLSSLHPGYGINIVSVLISTGDFEWWAERFLAQTYGYDRTTKLFDAPPKGVEVNANVAYDLEPNGDIRILLMNANGATTVVDYRPTDYVRMGNYLQCAYQTVQSFDGGITSSTRPAKPGEVDTTVFSSDSVSRAGETQVTTTKTVVSISGSTATVTLSQVIDVTSRPKYLLYQMGTGKYPTLDAQMTTDQLAAPYFPSIPVRVDNVSWTDAKHQATPLYKTSDALLKKVGLNLKDLGDKVTANQNIKDIDYCFVAFGVRLNTQSPEGKRYLFRYFSYLRSISKVTSGQYNSWVAGSKSNAPPINTVEIYSEKDRANNHDVKLQWQYIDTRLVTGQVRANARVGDVEILLGSGVIQFGLRDDMVVDGSKVLARRQVDDNTYEELEISGLTYENFIYKGKSVIITAHESLSNEDNEGFIVPLNQEIVRVTPMVELTNLSYQCMYMVFNCYKVVKQKWYQTTLFKIIIVIVSIIIIVCTWGSGTPAAASLMAAAFVAAGVAVTIAIVLAATLYVLAVMLLMSILMKVATNVFGEKLGPIIVAVAAIVSQNYSSLGATTGTTATTYLTAQNIIQASSALAGAYISGQLSDVTKDMAKATEAYNAGMKQVEEMTKDNLGTNLGLIDVQGLTQSTYQMNYEMPDTFLNRTLMTGSDVCDITTGLIENFVDVGLRLPTTG